MKLRLHFNIILLFLVLGFSDLSAQDFYMEDGDAITTNSGFFYDPGPPGSGIQQGDFVYTICPDGDLYTTIQFIESFNIGPTHLKIYDGADTSADLLYDFTQQGEAFVPDFNTVYSGLDESTNCLTFEFSSPITNDGIQGWKAIIGTRPQCITDAPELVSFSGGVNVQNDPNYPGIDYLVYFNEDFTIETTSQFQDNTAQVDAQYNWDFGNGDTDTGSGAEVTYSYSELCDFNITLDLEDGYDCQRDDFELTVRVDLNPDNSPGSVNLDAGNDIRLCEEPGTPMTVDLTADYMDVKEATAYEVMDITEEFPSNIPYVFDACYPSDSEVFTELNGDDDWSEAFQLAYEVNFFGNCYDNIIITDNGAVSFDIQGVVPGGRYDPGGYADWSYEEGIPTDAGSSNSPYVNSIFGVLQDLYPGSNDNPAGQSINYGFIESEDGKSDRFVFNIYETSQFSCTEQHQTSQIILYQTTNVIEVYIANKDECQFNSGSSIVGIQNKDGTIGYAAPGRNAGPESPWSTQNEAWRFVPDGGNSITTFKWYDEAGNVVSTDENFSPTVTQDTYFTAEVTYDDGCNVTTLTDRIDVLYESDIEIEFAEDTFYPCEGEEFLIEVLTTENNDVPVYYTWFKDGVEIPDTDPESRYLNVSESGTYSVIVEGGNCVLEESVEVSYLDDIDTDNPEDIILCNYNDPNYDLTGIGGFSDLTGFDATYYGAYDPETGDLSNEITDPENYSLANADEHEIFVELSNQANTSCTNIASFIIYEYEVDINPSDYVAEDICINEDSTQTIDLTDGGNNTSNALNGQDPSEYTVTYFDEDPLNFPDANIDDPSNYTIDAASNLGPNTIWITIYSNGNQACNAVADFSFNVNLEPTITSENVVIESCEGSIINLNDYDSTFNNNSTNMAVTVNYYLSEADYDNDNPIDPANVFEFTPDPNTGEQTLFVNVKNDDSSCESDLVSFQIISEPPSIGEVDDLAQCGDYSNTQTFDLTQNEVNIIGVQQGDFNISYYLTEGEAENGANSITDQGLDNLAFSPNNSEQDIFFRIENVANNNCFNIGSFALIINDVEAIQPNDLEACIDPVTGVAIYDLTLSQDEVLGNNQTIDDYDVNYYDANMDLIGNPTQFETQVEQIITVEVVNQDDVNCTESARLQLIITPQPIASVPPILEVCINYDIDDTQIDLTQQDDFINMDGGDEVVYYDSVDAFNNDNGIENPEAYSLDQGQTQIYAAVVNIGSNCRSDMVSFEIDNVLPEVDITNFDGRTVCIDENGNLIVTENSPPVIETGLSAADHDFEWQLDGITLAGETSSNIVAESPGEYTVIVTNALSNIACENTSSATILETGQIDFDLTVLTDNFQNNEHSIGVIFTLIGLGDYEVKLDYGDWFDLEDGQTEIILNNLMGGEHTVTVRDKFGCGMVQKSITLIDFPEFFTPNEDGYNDTWNITSIDQEDAEIHIFDRYGKHIFSTSPTENGWDGTYNGEILPANDYWFTIKYKEPRTDQVKTFKSHFTLKR